MVNSNIQGAIPLQGRGFVAKVKRNYQSGEFRRLSNCELINGEIVNRRSILSAEGDMNVIDPMVNSHGFIGSVEDNVFMVSKTSQRVYSTALVINEPTYFQPSQLPVPLDSQGNANAACSHRIVGIFKYNRKVHWITHEYQIVFGGPDRHKICLYSSSVDDGDPIYMTFASLTRTDLVTEFVEEGGMFNTFPFFKTFFISRDRLVLVLKTGIYLSKASDPKVFAVPSGAFFKFPDQQINYAVALRDTIYVMCDEGIFSITYSSDPNTDSYVRPLAEMGGEWGVIHQDMPYFINRYGIYSISGNSVDKLIDSAFDTGDNRFIKTKLISFENYIIVVRYQNITYSSGSGYEYLSDPGAKYSLGLEGNTLNHNVIFINMENGAVHTVDFVDYPDSTNPAYVVDVFVNKQKTFFSDVSCFFMTNREVETNNNPKTYHANVSIMKAARNENVLYDRAASTLFGAYVRFKPNVCIEIDGYTPDGNEYNIKKFRSLQLMGNLTKSDFTVNVAYDNKDYSAVAKTLTSPNLDSIEAAGEARPPYPFKVGLNQRGRAISIIFKTANPNTVWPNNNTFIEPLRISDLRVLWTYTGRGPTTKNP